MRSLAALTFALALASPAVAQSAKPPQPKGDSANSVQQNLGLGSHNMRAPINVSSNSFEGDTATKVGTYIGNVVVTQGDMKMRADRVRLDMAGGDLAYVTSTGNVVVVAPNGTGTGDKGVYDLKKHIVTLTGKVVLTKQKNVMRGTKLVMDLNTNLAHLTAQGTPGGRVQAVFNPPPQKNAGARDNNTVAKQKTPSTASNPAPKNDK